MSDFMALFRQLAFDCGYATPQWGTTYLTVKGYSRQTFLFPCSENSFVDSEGLHRSLVMSDRPCVRRLFTHVGKDGRCYRTKRRRQSMCPFLGIALLPLNPPRRCDVRHKNLYIGIRVDRNLESTTFQPHPLPMSAFRMGQV